MDGYLDIQLKENFENAEIIISLIFIFVDIIFIIFNIFNLKSKTENIYSLKNKLFGLFFIDIILRIMNSNRNDKLKSLKREILLSILKTIQFFFILSFLEKVYNDTKLTIKGKFYKKLSQKQLCSIFLLITFPYDIFLSSLKIEICFIQYMIIIYSIFMLYNLLRNKMVKTVKNIAKQKTTQNKKYFLFILQGSSLPCLILFVTYYILKICFLPFQITNNIIYTNIILIIIKYSSKYFLYSILITLLYILNEINMQHKQYDEISRKNKFN